MRGQEGPNLGQTESCRHEPADRPAAAATHTATTHLAQGLGARHQLLVGPCQRCVVVCLPPGLPLVAAHHHPVQLRGGQQAAHLSLHAQAARPGGRRLRQARPAGPRVVRNHDQSSPRRPDALRRQQARHMFGQLGVVLSIGQLVGIGLQGGEGGKRTGSNERRHQRQQRAPGCSAACFSTVLQATSARSRAPEACRQPRRAAAPTSQSWHSISPEGSTSLTPLSGAGLWEAVMQMPVICCVFRALAAIMMPHLRRGKRQGRGWGEGAW
jgi:hypothetical protein